MYVGVVVVTVVLKDAINDDNTKQNNKYTFYIFQDRITSVTLISKKYTHCQR